MELNVSEHKGMSVLIYAAKLPSYLYQLIWNLESSKKLGKMIKRTGYKEILTAGLTSLKSMFEFVDDNDGRQIFIQDGTGVEESVYAGSAYGAITAIANDDRTAGSTVDQAHPVLHEKVLRSGAGLNAATDLPFWYGYIKAVTRFPNSVTPIAISAGKYLYDQFHDDAFTDLFKSGVTDFGSYASKVATTGLTGDRYIVYLVPLLDGTQRGLPYIADDHSLYNRVALAIPNFDDYASIYYNLEIPTANQAKLKRITDIDVFVADCGDFGSDDLLKAPAYFLERIPLDGDGPVIMSLQGTFENANPPTYIEFTDDFADWETFALYDLHIRFVYSGTEYTYRLTTPRAENSTKVRYPLSANGAAALQNQTVTCDVLSRWQLTSGNYEYICHFDDHHKKLGSEMFAYLNAPAGDVGLSDFRYKYSCMSNKRYFIFGRPDGPFGYYSTLNSPDVMPSLNILKLKKEPTGCIAVGRDVMAFYKDSAKRFTVISNANAEEDDDFSDIGLVGQKALVQLSDEEAYGFDQRGPWHLRLRDHNFIGEHLKEWWEDNLSETQKSACVVGYNRLKNWVMFSFPTYTTSPYTTGIVFVFDRDAQKRDGINAWWIYKTDKKIYDFTQADDLHLLAASTTEIFDFNTTGTPDETVATKATLKLINNPILGNRLHINTAYFDYTSDTDTVLVKVSADGAAQESLTVLGDKQAVIKYMCSKLELEISTAASANVVEYGSHLITFQPKRI